MAPTPSADGGDAPEAGPPDGWPVALRGVTESVVTTLGPNDRWNAAALGLHAPSSREEGDCSGRPRDGDGSRDPDGSESRPDADAPVTARTWGRTRTRRNFTERGGGVVQFVSDPRAFVDAALTISESDDPVLPAADAWVEVSAERLDAGEDGGTEWVEWALHPEESAILSERPLTINRGFYAVVDATVAASRLDVDAYDADELLDRLAYFAETVERCGGPAEREAFATVDEVTGWRGMREEREPRE